MRSIWKTKFAINYSAALYPDRERARQNKFGMRETGVQTLRSVLIDRLTRNIESQRMQHPIFRHGVKTIKILSKNTPAVISPYPDSLPREAAVNDEIQVVIAIHVNRCDVDAQTVRVGERKGNGLMCLAQLQLNAVNVSTVALSELPAKCEIGFVIAIQIAEGHGSEWITEFH